VVKAQDLERLQCANESEGRHTSCYFAKKNFGDFDLISDLFVRNLNSDLESDLEK
jgi:hypothetical protein